MPLLATLKHMEARPFLILARTVVYTSIRRTGTEDLDMPGI